MENIQLKEKDKLFGVFRKLINLLIELC